MNNVRLEAYQLKALIFFSQNICIDSQDHNLIIDKFARRNSHKKVTGFFFEKKGFLFQYVETNAELIDRLFETLSKDARYKMIFKAERKIRYRRFESWSRELTKDATAAQKVLLKQIYEISFKAHAFSKFLILWPFKVAYTKKLWFELERFRVITLLPDIKLKKTHHRFKEQL